jgi:hypothetical protein
MRRAGVDDAARVNAWVERDSGQPVDFTEFLSNPLNICLLSGEGGALFVWRGRGIYETHCFFEQRGREVRDISIAMLRAMFAIFGAKLIWAAVPLESRKVSIFVRWLGFKYLETIDMPHGRCELFEMEVAPCLQP